MSEPRIIQMDHPGLGGTVNFAGGGERTYSVGATVLYGDYPTPFGGDCTGNASHRR